MANETSKRLQASPGGFSEVTALSQHGINAAMASLAKKNPEIMHVESKTKRGDSLIAEISQPQISLHVTGSSRADLEYFAQFSSGKLHFNYDPPQEYNVTGWIIAFDVKIDSVKIEPGSKEDKTVRGAIKQAGDFSLTSLFLTFNEGNIIKPNLDHSNFKGAKLDDDDIIAFGGILAKWYVAHGPMTDRQKRMIGYRLQTANPESVNKLAPSFPPTSLRFQTYEYIAPGKTKSFPAAPILPYTGNFVSPGMGGTMCIEKGLFWDRHLLRETTPQLLHLFNNSTYAWAKSIDLTKDFRYPEWEIGIGDSTHLGDPKFFAWKPGNKSPLTWNWGSPREAEQSMHAKDKTTTSSSSVDITCTVNNTMHTEPGSNVIQLSGRTEVQVSAALDKRHVYPVMSWSCDYTIRIWLEWKTTITINTVDEGGLSISLNLDEKNFTVSTAPLEFSSAGTSDPLKKSVEAKQSKMENVLIENLRNSPLKTTETQLEKDLNNSARFVLPGQGTFHYRNPMFNEKGDLLVEIDYRE